ncbi:MAG: ATP-binding protein, partial [Cyanobacteria bacterium J06576_12]
AVMNLVQNAVRHTQPGDTIALGSLVTDGYLKFWVRDTGEGIATENQKRIFKRFTRATHNDRQFEGAGLGLSIVSAIVQAHGGRIELASEVGQGTTFTLIIPLDSSVEPLETTGYESNPHCRGQSAHRRLSEHWAQGTRLQHPDR